MQDPKHDAIVYGAWLAMLGAMIAMGKLLSSDKLPPLRVCAGRVILGSATSMIAGMLLLQFANIPPLALIATGSALGIAGSQLVEALMLKWGTKRE